MPDRLAVAFGGLRCLRVARFSLLPDGGGGGGQFVRPRLGLCDGLIVLGGGDDAVFKRFLGLCGRTLQIGGGSGVFDACGQLVVGGFGFPRAVFRRVVQTLHLFARQGGRVAALLQLPLEGGKFLTAFEFGHHLLETRAYQGGMFDAGLFRLVGGRLKVFERLPCLLADAVRYLPHVHADFGERGLHRLRGFLRLAADVADFGRRFVRHDAGIAQRLFDFGQILRTAACFLEGFNPCLFGFLRLALTGGRAIPNPT